MLTNNERQAMIVRIQTALHSMQRLDAQFPGERTFASIIAQLTHVLGALTENRSPLVKDKELNFGFLGMKFVYEFDEKLGGELAEIHHVIATHYS